MTTLLLCSASPRRRELLSTLGLSFEVVPPLVDESRREGELVRDFVQRLALEKAEAGLRLYATREGALPAPHVAIAADTIVVIGHEVLGKPADRADAARMLGALSGIEHRVLTAVSVVGERARSRCVETLVRFKELSEAEIRWLVDSGDGDDKAGAYAVQGLAGLFVERIDGSFSNVVGLPMTETIDLLDAAGVALPW